MGPWGRGLSGVGRWETVNVQTAFKKFGCERGEKMQMRGGTRDRLFQGRGSRDWQEPAE